MSVFLRQMWVDFHAAPMNMEVGDSEPLLSEARLQCTDFCVIPERDAPPSTFTGYDTSRASLLAPQNTLHVREGGSTWHKKSARVSGYAIRSAAKYQDSYLIDWCAPGRDEARFSGSTGTVGSGFSAVDPRRCMLSLQEGFSCCLYTSTFTNDSRGFITRRLQVSGVLQRIL